MKKIFISLCLFLAVSTVFALNFVPDPSKIYNIVEVSSNNVIGVGTAGNQPSLTDKADITSQAFTFVPVAGKADTYYVLSSTNLYINVNNTQSWATVAEAAINATDATKSEWVIDGADATTVGIGLKNNTTGYMGVDNTSLGNQVWTNKGPGNGHYLYKLQEATIYTGTPSTLYYETFAAAGLSQSTDWNDKPSTLAGANKWPGGVDLQTTGDGNLNLVSWDNQLRLKLISTSAALIIPDINVAGYTNLQFSIDGYRQDAPLAPILSVKVGAGPWVLQSTPGVGNYWNWTTGVSSIKDASGVQLSDVSTISLQISNTNTGTATYLLDNVKVLGRPKVATSLSSASKEVFSVYPNPATNYILTNNAQKVTITDLNGRIVKEAFNAEKVDVSSLAKGVYIVNAQIGNAIKIGKLIKE